MFDEEGALDKLEGFASEFGPRFYGLPVNEERVQLRRSETLVPESVVAGDAVLRPFRSGQTLPWRFEGSV